MFSKKYSLPITCDSYIDLYNTCNIDCEHCKFQKGRKTAPLEILPIDFKNYVNKKILFCYSVDPYPYGYENISLVKDTISKLHQSENSIVFLTRRAPCVMKDLEVFNINDWVGVSISENCINNSTEAELKTLFEKAHNLGLKTWISLEPIVSYEFTASVIETYSRLVDFIRVGRDDLKEYDYEEIREQLEGRNYPNVFIK